MLAKPGRSRSLELPVTRGTKVPKDVVVEISSEDEANRQSMSEVSVKFLTFSMTKVLIDTNEMGSLCYPTASFCFMSRFVWIKTKDQRKG